MLVVHGTEDRVASLARTRAVVANLRRRADIELREVPGGRHAMVRRGAVFERAAAAFCVETLLS